MYQVLVDKPTYSENYHHQKKFYQENNLNYAFAVSVFYLTLLLVLSLVANVLSFVFKSELFTKLEILDLSANSFSFIFESSMLLISLL